MESELGRYALELELTLARRWPAVARTLRVEIAVRETYGGFVVERAGDSSASEIYPQRGAAEEARRALIVHHLIWWDSWHSGAFACKQEPV